MDIYGNNYNAQKKMDGYFMIESKLRYNFETSYIKKKSEQRCKNLNCDMSRS